MDEGTGANETILEHETLDMWHLGLVSGGMYACSGRVSMFHPMELIGDMVVPVDATARGHRKEVHTLAGTRSPVEPVRCRGCALL